MNRESVDRGGMNDVHSLFVLADAAKCSGCRACELACFAAHCDKKAKTVGTAVMPVVPRLFLTRGEAVCMPVQCHHCEDAPCIRSCLTGAISRQNDIVLIDARKCIGCRNCAIACPFGAIEVRSQAEFDRWTDGQKSAAKGAPELVYKCDLCVNGKKPACAAACPNDALRLVDAEAELLAKREHALSADWTFDARGGSTDGRVSDKREV